ATGRPAGQAAATPGAPRTIAGSWKAYQLDYSTSPPSAATDLIALAEDGTFLLRRGTAYRGGDQPRLETVGGDSGTYTLLGDALTLRFADGSVKTGAVDGENLAIGGRTYYPCSGFGC
ncbi:MAG: hypothetical protein FJZ01_25865, partial [Candidatus Sericytochromatia bacterium]|nr:hypothetical protein [Candidatus Tanganyikabacteria bacterium]